MNKTLRAKLTAELDAKQAGTHARTLLVDQAISLATEIERFLRRAPDGTTVYSCHDRLPNSYRYRASATGVMGERKGGNAEIHVFRGNAFGNRDWIVAPPCGHVVRGDGTHSSGACHDLRTARIEARS